MADEPLSFNPDDLGAFDRAPDPSDALAAFDNATGATFVPAGIYLCRLEAGELTTTRAGKQAYRLRFVVVEPTEHAGFPLWRYYTFADKASANRAKAALAPLRISTSADLQRIPFPEAGRVIICRVVVGIQKDDPTRNDVVRFTVVSDDRDDGTAASRFALPPKAGEGGSAP
jgi:hypothetical protein